MIETVYCGEKLREVPGMPGFSYTMSTASALPPLVKFAPKL